VDSAQELPGLRTLDDAVVIGRGEGQDLADTVAHDRFQSCALELGGVLHSTDADDDALAWHEAGHRMHGADRAGVGQARGRPGEVVHTELACATAVDEVLVGVTEGGEVHVLADLDARHE
jgi:hypothetical protein